MAVNLKESNIKGLLMDIVGDTISSNCQWVRTTGIGAELHTVWENLLVEMTSRCVFIQNSSGEITVRQSQKEYTDLITKLYDAASVNAATVWNRHLLCKPEEGLPVKVYPNTNKGTNVPAIKPDNIERRERHGRKKTKHIKVQFEMWIDKE